MIQIWPKLVPSSEQNRLRVQHYDPGTFSRSEYFSGIFKSTF